MAEKEQRWSLSQMESLQPPNLNSFHRNPLLFFFLQTYSADSHVLHSCVCIYTALPGLSPHLHIIAGTQPASLWEQTQWTGQIGGHNEE